MSRPLADLVATSTYDDVNLIAERTFADDWPRLSEAERGTKRTVVRKVIAVLHDYAAET